MRSSSCQQKVKYSYDIAGRCFKRHLDRSTTSTKGAPMPKRSISCGDSRLRKRRTFLPFPKQKKRVGNVQTCGCLNQDRNAAPLKRSPERSVPVLIDCSFSRRCGAWPSVAWMTGLRAHPQDAPRVFDGRPVHQALHGRHFENDALPGARHVVSVSSRATLMGLVSEPS